MKPNRRQFLQAAATTVATSTAASRAADPFAPAEPNLTAKWFDKGKQHVLPAWAFDGYAPSGGVARNPPRRLQVPPTPRPTFVSDYASLSLQATGGFTPAALNAFGDGKAPGQVLHGIAAEWNGSLIGGNTQPGSTDNRAWNVMKARVQPDRQSGYGGDLLDNPASATKLANWGAFQDNVRCYKIVMREILGKLHPEATHPALLYSYAGMVPGPTFRFRHGIPCVVRFENKLETEVSIHHHGGHNPTHADGFPSYYALQGEARDYLYPNILPLRHNGVDTELDFGEGQSTTWYHDHGLDATAFNVSHGLAGFALWFDELELKLIRDGKLPGLTVIAKPAQGNIPAVYESISANEITVSDDEFKRWKEAWQKLGPSAGSSPGPLYTEWLDLMKRAGGGGASAATVDGAAKDPDLENFYHRRSANELPGVGTPYFNPYDVPIVLQDRVIDRATGQIVYDSDGHNGYIGDVQLINGRPWPAFKVKRRKYRLRLLDGSNARIYQLRFLDSDTFDLRPTGNATGELEPAAIPAATLEARSMEFFRIGKDSWLWPTPQKRKTVLLNMANRADLVVDFKAWYEDARHAGRLVPDPEDSSKLVAEYYLVNAMPQFDGRGPKTKLADDAGDPNVFPLPFVLNGNNPVVRNMVDQGSIPAGLAGNAGAGAAQLEELEQPVGLVKFLIEEDVGEGEDCPGWMGESTILRPRHAIKDEEVMAVREFVFERGKGAWMINSRFYDPTISNASPIVGIKGQKFKVPTSELGVADKQSLTYAEEWILRNGGGGWWHPIHIHLEGHQLIGYEKDFEADDFVGADGILGVQGQANMNALPPWTMLVGQFGLGTLNLGANASPIIRALTLPNATDFNPQFVAASGRLLDLVLAVREPGAALFKELRDGPTIRSALSSLTATQQVSVNRLLDALDELRRQWAGEVVGNHDTQALGPNTVARIRMRFRTWTGPLVFHCHNVEHEDMRMMVNFEPTMSGKCSELNEHDPDTAPAARSHGQDVTDLVTNPHAVGEMPWEAIDGFPHYGWEEEPVPGTPVDQAGDPLIKPREPSK